MAARTDEGSAQGRAPARRAGTHRPRPLRDWISPGSRPPATDCTGPGCRPSRFLPLYDGRSSHQPPRPRARTASWIRPDTRRPVERLRHCSASAAILARVSRRWRRSSAPRPDTLWLLTGSESDLLVVWPGRRHRARASAPGPDRTGGPCGEPGATPAVTAWPTSRRPGSRPAIEGCAFGLRRRPRR